MSPAGFVPPPLPQGLLGRLLPHRGDKTPQSCSGQGRRLGAGVGAPQGAGVGAQQGAGVGVPLGAEGEGWVVAVWGLRCCCHTCRGTAVAHPRRCRRRDPSRGKQRSCPHRLLAGWREEELAVWQEEGLGARRVVVAGAGWGQWRQRRCCRVHCRAPGSRCHSGRWSHHRSPIASSTGHWGSGR